MLKYCLTVVDGGYCHLSRLDGWVCLILSCVTNRKDSHKLHHSIIMRYYLELQVLDISIVSERLEMTTRCLRSILTVRNDDRVCTHFWPERLERMTGQISPMTFTSASLTRTFLWWRHSLIRICVIRLTVDLPNCGNMKILTSPIVPIMLVNVTQ